MTGHWFGFILWYMLLYIMLNIASIVKPFGCIHCSKNYNLPLHGSLPPPLLSLHVYVCACLWWLNNCLWSMCNLTSIHKVSHKTHYSYKSHTVQYTYFIHATTIIMCSCITEKFMITNTIHTVQLKCVILEQIYIGLAKKGLNLLVSLKWRSGGCIPLKILWFIFVTTIVICNITN